VPPVGAAAIVIIVAAMRTSGLFFVVGLFAAVSAGCNGSSSSDKPADVKPVATATAAEPPPSAADGFDGSCKGPECVAKCDRLGRPRDCYEAGDAYRRGKDDLAANVPSAVKYLEKACAKKYSEGCYDLGHLYSVADKGVTQDVAKAITYQMSACEYGRGQACDELSKRAESGDGMPKDHAKAIGLLAKGCAAQDYQEWTCRAFKKAVDAKDADALKAVDAWKTACAAKEKAACKGLERADLK
jgi:TPR repeat protein